MLIDQILNNTYKGVIDNQQCLTLYNIAKTLPKNCFIVEIGSYRGRSTCSLAAGSLEGNNNQVIAIDLWDKNLKTNESQYNCRGLNFKNSINFDIFLEHVNKFNLNHLITFYKDSSYNISQMWNSNNVIGFLFIDGDHSYQGIKQDFENFEKFIINHGYIGFHDYNNKDFPEVRLFIDELLENNKQINLYKVVSNLCICKKEY